MALLFRKAASDARADAAAKLTEHARTVISADDETTVSVSEHDCGEPDCCGVRTIVLVMSSKRPTAAVSIDKPIAQVTAGDLSDALSPLKVQTGAAEPAPGPN
jgi:hypothetical protein